TNCMMGFASGSNFWITGASAVSGRSGKVVATLSRISCAPTSPDLSNEKLTTTVERPWTDVDRTSSMPLMVLTASSVRLVMSVSISSAVEPGLTTTMETVGTSTLGVRSTPKEKYENPPTTT